MSRPSTTCACPQCPGTTCTCGCASERAEPQGTCACCGTNCGCGPSCECKPR